MQLGPKAHDARHQIRQFILGGHSKYMRTETLKAVAGSIPATSVRVICHSSSLLAATKARASSIMLLMSGP